MIGYLTGKIISKKPTSILLDVNGVGYNVHISINTFDKMPDAGSIASLFTYLNVKEDSLTLFGFSTEAEKQMFELLISVNGIGPKIGIGILSGIQIEDLKVAIKSGNLNRITAIPGIGRKTAERMLIDLRDKVDVITDGKDITPASKTRDDAISALTTLGYNQKIAEKIIRDLLSSEPQIEIEGLIRKSLTILNK